MSSEFVVSEQELNYLLSPEAIRNQSSKILELCSKGSTHFSLHMDKLDDVSELVLQTTLSNYPDLKVPFHSRWGHFKRRKFNRLDLLEEKLSHLTPAEIARSKIDLVIVSVLLDAGAGDEWKYLDPHVGDQVARSEGLALVSFDLFASGQFSADANFPWRVDSSALMNMDLDQLGEAFQHGPDNPLVGLEGRLELLHALGKCLESSPHFDPFDKRPGSLYDLYKADVGTAALSAPALLEKLLRVLGPIWPGAKAVGGLAIGDIWEYPGIADPQSSASLIPFHKLSQWLSYSMMEPLAEGGIEIRGVNDLTGLAEYRNGGLLVDTELLQLRDPSLLNTKHAVDSQLIIEWRALTICLLDQIAEKVRSKLSFTTEEFPLVKLLEGGSWWAGRKIAAEKRPGGGPPIQIASTGTVF